MSSESKHLLLKLLLLFQLTLLLPMICMSTENKIEKDNRMKWWRDARFGMFIHFGSYSYLGDGEWAFYFERWNKTDYQQKVSSKFNPVQFNADSIAQLAKDAGMKYLVITAKHHEGFCMWPTNVQSFKDVTGTKLYDLQDFTAFKNRDILKELKEACDARGIKFCLYYSIMDWNHPSQESYYGPNQYAFSTMVSDSARLSYIRDMKAQLKELITNYHPAILWFDGDWTNNADSPTPTKWWTKSDGIDLYDYLRSLDSTLIINERVVRGFGVGDFLCPEQEIPSSGMNKDWETNMTINYSWGYNKGDHNWKSVKELIYNLVDIASKGGNFLLNIGPTGEGVVPEASIDRLEAMGNWMKVNGDSIYSTQGSLFKNLKWGKCTQKKTENGTRLYLHIFDWPDKHILEIPGISNKPIKAYLLADKNMSPLKIIRKEDALRIFLPQKSSDKIDSVVVLDIEGTPDIYDTPEFHYDFTKFLNSMDIGVTCDRNDVVMRYTTNGTIPNINSSIIKNSLQLTNSTILSVRCFKNGIPVSGFGKLKFSKVTFTPSTKIKKTVPGLKYNYYEGVWDTMPDFNKLKPKKSGIVNEISLSPKEQDLHFGFDYEGYINIPDNGMYIFYLGSDDGSKLYINNELVIDNDGVHAMWEKSGVAALAKGLHKIRTLFFQKEGVFDLKVYYSGPNIKKTLLPADILSCSENSK